MTMTRSNPLLTAAQASSFIQRHAAEIALAQAWQRRGRADSRIREACANKINEIYDRLIEQAPEESEEE